MFGDADYQQTASGLQIVGAEVRGCEFRFARTSATIQHIRKRHHKVCVSISTRCLVLLAQLPNASRDITVSVDVPMRFCVVRSTRHDGPLIGLASQVFSMGYAVDKPVPDYVGNAWCVNSPAFCHWTSCRLRTVFCIADNSVPRP